AQHFRRWFFLQLVEDALQPFMGMGQIVIRNVRIAFSMIPKSTTENGALVVHLADQYVAHNGGAASRIISAPVLFAPQQYIAGHGAFDPGQELAVGAQEADADALFRAIAQERRGNQNPSDADQAFQHVRRQAGPYFTLDFHDDVGAVLAKPGPFGGDVKRVELSPHGSI